jgi:hypothetical protein
MKKAQQQINATEPTHSSNYNTLSKAITELYEIVKMLLKAFLFEVVPFLYVIGATAIYMGLIIRHMIGGATC